MDREEALKILALERRACPEGEEYTAGYFEPSDGPGIARLFYAIYGDGYPIDTFYIPERLAAENRLGNIRSVVARTASGDVVCHVAFYRSSAPNPNLYEIGLGLTLPAYRSSFAFARCNNMLLALLGTNGIDGFFGEAVCNHIITQKLALQVKSVETALEPALMPAKAYETEQSAAGRVGCMMSFRVDRDRRRIIHVPVAYRDELQFLLDGLNLDREFVFSDNILSGNCGDIEMNRFDFAGVARCTVSAPGAGLAAQLATLEQKLRADNYALIQFFVDLGKPWSSGVVNQLRDQGFCLGGLLPVWFGDDGLLMQKHIVSPDFDSMKIYSERGRRILALVKQDWERRG